MEPDVETACPPRLHRHVRRIQVPVDHIAVFKASRLGVGNPIVLNHQIMRRTTDIVSRSTGVAQSRWFGTTLACSLVKTRECNAASDQAIMMILWWRTKAQAIYLAHGLRPKGETLTDNSKSL
jgi:hypothetical protein